jgi:hypothetical protein
MNDNLTYPTEGKLVTVIAVDQGEPLVTYGTVLVIRPNHLLALQIKVEKADLERYTKAPVTVLYGDADYSLILRGRVSEIVNPDRIVISIPDQPRIGERREFIRADLELGVWLQALPEQVTDEADAREAVDELSRDPSDYKFRNVEVDLSGSGARFVFPVNLRKNGMVAVAFELSDEYAEPMVVLPASTVRARPAKGTDASQEVALTFCELTEEESDLLNIVVFQARAIHLGISATHLSEEQE